MRIAIISDVHGSLAALEAVAGDIKRESPDLILHSGDLALSGPRPAEVVDLIRALGWPGVVGNTDELLWRPEELAVQEAKAPKLQPLLRILFAEFAPATAAMLGSERINWLRSLPRVWRQADLAIVHANPQDLWRAPLPDAADRVLHDTYGDLGAAMVVFGHIHRPFVRQLPDLTVANSGSVGMPYDEDCRASYLLISDGFPEVKRVEYDLSQDLADLYAEDYPRAGWLAEMRRRGAYIVP